MDRRKFLTVTGSGALLGLAGCGGCSGKGNAIKIVSSLPRTGSAQGQTNTIVNGIKMAIDDYGGEIAGMKIAYQDMDDATAAQGQWDAGKESDNAREAVGDKNVMVFIGPYNSGAAKSSMPILNEAGLVQISPAATWPGLTKKVPGDDKSGEPGIYRKEPDRITFCRVCPTDFVQGPLSAVFVKDVLKAKRVYILDDKELYGAGIANLFKKKCDELGIQVLGHESIVATQQNFKTLIQAIKGKNPELLYFGGTSQTKGPQIAHRHEGRGPEVPADGPGRVLREGIHRRGRRRSVQRTHLLCHHRRDGPVRVEGRRREVRQEVQGEVRERPGSVRRVRLRGWEGRCWRPSRRSARKTARRFAKRFSRPRTSTRARSASGVSTPTATPL